MSVAEELAALFSRDLKRLREEVEAFPEQGSLWAVLPGVTNSAGNLALHLEGNLREFVGRQLGGIAYTRERPLEFSTKDLPVGDLAARMAALIETIPPVVAGLDADRLETPFPYEVQGELLPTRQFLIHLHGHLTYHLGQINYLRRILTGA
jgi:uncharacterized damage-inducible protein DinB